MQYIAWGAALVKRRAARSACASAPLLGFGGSPRGAGVFDPQKYIAYESSNSLMPDVFFTTVAGRRNECAWHGPDRAGPPIVMLHEGLGSVSMWRDFPERLSEATGRRVLVASRYGHGRSAELEAPRTPGYLHEEALVALPELLDRLEIRAPVLFGHSDGGSIALIYAASSGRAVSGIVALAPHVKVEDISVEAIRGSREAYLHGDLRARLSRHHEHVDSLFWGWNDIWLADAFRAWNIEALLPRIACPILAIQGEQDQYGTMEQIESIARHAPRVELLKVADCRHSPHRDQPQRTLDAAQRFCCSLSA
jgi:pimeloyl-ACP methyl ester carboxylesterase